MSGFDNEVVVCLGERLEPSTSQAIQLMQATSNDVARINYVGNPEGNIAANPSSLCHDPAGGQVYYKRTGTGNTGWQQIGNSTYMDFSIIKGLAQSLTTATNKNLIALALTGGTWIVSAIAMFSGDPTVSGPVQLSTSLNSLTHGDLGNNSVQTVWPSNIYPITDTYLSIPNWIVNVESTLNCYMVVSANFSAGSVVTYGRMNAIKIVDGS